MGLSAVMAASMVPALPVMADDASGKVYYLNFKPEQDEAWQNLAAKYTEETGVPVTVVTAASGQYETTLQSEMAKSDAPTLFQVNGPVGLKNWKDYCYDLSGSDIYSQLTSDAYTVKDGDAVDGIAYVIESYGLIVNKTLLEKAGYTVDDIKSFDDLKKVADDIQARKDELGIKGAFLAKLSEVVIRESKDGYPELADKGPVPLKNYLNESEQKLWFQGDDTAYRGMNGLEMKELLDRLEKKFYDWYNRSLYELSFEVIRPFIAEIDRGKYMSRLDEVKDSLYLGYQPKDDDPDPDPELICQLLDTHYHTDCFSLLYKEKQQEVDKRFVEETRPIELFGAVIQYELKMPGQMISANTTFRDREYLVWKVDAYRLLAGEYSLTARSRVPNVWAFILTGVLILLGIGFWIKKR